MLKPNRYTYIAAIIIGAGIMLGAFGSHALKEVLSSARLVTWQTAVEYQMYAGLGLFLQSLIGHRHITYIKNLLLAGCIVFCGSLYLLCLTDTAWLGAITPIGGVLMILSWCWLAILGFVASD